MQAEPMLSLRAPESIRSLPLVHREWLRSALLDDPRASLESVLDDIEGERAQLWAVGAWGRDVEALIVTRLIQYDRCYALEVQLCAGRDMEHWLHLLAELERHARNLGCRFVEVRGRRGWERVLPDYAFRGVSLAKEL